MSSAVAQAASSAAIARADRLERVIEFLTPIQGFSSRAASGASLSSGEAEADFLEIPREARPHGLDLLLRFLRERDVVHVVHAAGDEHLQDAFLGADVTEGAAHAR